MMLTNFRQWTLTQGELGFAREKDQPKPTLPKLLLKKKDGSHLIRRQTKL